MSSVDVVRNALAKALETVPTDTGYTATTIDDPEGYGVDTWCLTDSKVNQVVVTGAEGVALDVARRYITARGTLGPDPDYGLLLSDFLHGALVGSPRTWELQVEIEALKDKRVRSAACRWIATTPTNHDVTLTLTIPTVAGDSVQSLTFAVTPERVALLA